MSSVNGVPARVVRAPVAVRAVVALVLAVVVSSLVCLVVSLVAQALGADGSMRALSAGTFVPFIVIGCLLGTVGWLIIRVTARRPEALMRVLAPVVLVVSLVPDILVGATKAMPGTSWPGIVALMIMHVVVAAALVPALLYFVPAPDRVRH